MGAIALAVMLAGCATPSHTNVQAWTNASVPDNWSGANAALKASTEPENLQTWWTRFQDPVLSSLIDQALTRNLSAQSAAASLRQARALNEVQGASNGPGISGSVSGQRSKSGDAAASNRFNAGFDASWEIDVFGGNASALRATGADAAAAATSLADVKVSLAAEVASAYIDVRAYQQRLAIARSNLEAQTETFQITDWRMQAGLSSSLEREQALTAREQTAAQIPALATSLGQSLHALAVLCGEAPAALDERLAAPAGIPTAPAALAMSFPAQTLQQRPDVRTAALQWQAANARVDVADAARLPGFKLSGSLGLSALTLSGLGDGGASAANSLLASITAPIFDGGALKAQAQAQAAAEDKAAIAYRQAILTALQDVEDALVSIRGNQERLKRLSVAAESAAQADLLARQRYRSGLVDFASVLETQRTLLSAQDSVATVRAALSGNMVQLYKALGGGWQPDDSASGEVVPVMSPNSTKTSS